MTVNYGELGFYRVAAAAPVVAIANPALNGQRIAECARKAAADGACIAVFPELAVSGYTCEDLFHSDSLLEGTRTALSALLEATAGLPMVTVVGAPYRTAAGRQYNCAFVLYRGSVRGAVPKTYLPNYGEYYEHRWFASGAGVDHTVHDERLGSFRLGARQLFSMGRLILGIEICEDLWAPVPPSSEHALAGANVIVNPSASNDWVSKADYRRELVRQQSARLNAGYVYSSCGPSESTKDVVYGGHSLIAENGVLLADSARFEKDASTLTADIDVDRLLHERARNVTFARSPLPASAYVLDRLAEAPNLPALRRTFSCTPFVPDEPHTVDERASEIIDIQSTGLARRLEASSSENAVIGISGGLDSTLALLVSVRAMERLGRPPARVLAVSMPGFGTTERTRRSAKELADCLGVTFREVSIVEAVERHFRDIGHDLRTHDVVFENAQARERTQILFDLANKHRGIVVGTGDMSELALGWCTYNADHMASYAVNVSVPKTLVKHLVRWYAENRAAEAARKVLEVVLSTTISPELLPPTSEGIQSTEESIGPYVLHDFFLFHHVRNGFGPRKVFTLACQAFDGTYGAEEIRRWLRVFLERFYRQQFKRTCLPPGPKVGSVSLSPRGDWRMPDEADPQALLGELDSLG